MKIGILKRLFLIMVFCSFFNKAFAEKNHFFSFSYGNHGSVYGLNYSYLWSHVSADLGYGSVCPTMQSTYKSAQLVSLALKVLPTKGTYRPYITGGTNVTNKSTPGIFPFAGVGFMIQGNRAAGYIGYDYLAKLKINALMGGIGFML